MIKVFKYSPFIYLLSNQICRNIFCSVFQNANIYDIEMFYEHQKLNIDIESVRKGIGSDPRIGYSFIYPGVGYGGSCFPKDVKAIIHTARKLGLDPLVLQSVSKRNDLQKRKTCNKRDSISKENLLLFKISPSKTSSPLLSPSLVDTLHS